MEAFDINILGCGSASPSTRHKTSCQVVNFREKLMMVDCGEGAQWMFRRMGLKFSRLAHIFISHLHGDHVFGIPGLISTFALHHKGGEVTIHTFAEGRDMLEPYLRFFCRDMPFEVKFDIITPESGIIYEDRGLTVETFPLYHRVPCTGFIFREKQREPSFRADVGRFFNVPVKAIADIKRGADFVTDDGRVIPNDRLVIPAPRPLSYAYCSDTRFDMRVARSVEGVDVVYHEATYDSSLRQQAWDRGHSTAAEAARIAAAAGARWLVIGHYSQRYHDDAELVADAMSTGFTNVIGATEGLVIPVADPSKAFMK